MKLSFQGKIVPLLIIALVVLLVSGLLSYISTNKFIENSDRVSHTYQVLAEIEATVSNVKDAEISQRNYLLTNQDSYLDSFNQARTNETNHLNTLRQLTADNSQQTARVNTLEKLLKQHIDFTGTIISTKQQQGTQAAAQVLREGQGRQILDHIRQVSEDMENEENRLLETRSDDADSSAQQTIWLIFSLIGIVFILFVLIYYLLNRQISQRRSAEQALSQSEKQMRLITDNIPAQVSYVDAEGRFKFVNKHVEDWAGRSAGQIVGKHFVETLDKKVSTAIQERANQALNGQAVNYEQHRFSRSGQEHIFRVTYLPHFNENQQVLGFYSFVEDVTGPKQAEEQIRNLNKENEKRVNELSVVNHELEAFSYSVSHDLRAPLRSINGFSQALLEDYSDQLDDEGKDYLVRVRKASQRMAELIDDLLSLSRLSRTEMKSEEVELSKIAQEIGAELQTNQPERQVTLKIQPDLTATGDKSLLQVVLQNLISNAWKFTQKRAHGCIEFGVSCEKGESIYFVRDNGAGFDMAYANKLFGAFQRLHAVTEFEGTGIGLAIVQRVIHRHGGRVWAEGVLDQGATFYFTL